MFRILFLLMRFMLNLKLISRLKSLKDGILRQRISAISAKNIAMSVNDLNKVN